MVSPAGVLGRTTQQCTTIALLQQFAPVSKCVGHLLRPHQILRAVVTKLPAYQCLSPEPAVCAPTQSGTESRTDDFTIACHHAIDGANIVTWDAITVGPCVWHDVPATEQQVWPRFLCFLDYAGLFTQVVRARPSILPGPPWRQTSSVSKICRVCLLSIPYRSRPPWKTAER